MLNNFDHQCSAPSVWDGTFERKVYFGVLVLLGELMYLWRASVIRAGPMHFMALPGHRTQLRPTLPVPLR